MRNGPRYKWNPACDRLITRDELVVRWRDKPKPCAEMRRTLLRGVSGSGDWVADTRAPLAGFCDDDAVCPTRSYRR